MSERHDHARWFAYGESIADKYLLTRQGKPWIPRSEWEQLPLRRRLLDLLLAREPVREEPWRPWPFNRGRRS